MSESIRIVSEDAALVCDLLASAFLYGPSQLDKHAQDLWYRHLSRQTPAVRYAWGAVADILDGKEKLQQAIQDFQQCVEVPVPGRYVPPYASCYLNKPATLWGPSTFKVLEWYEQGGLEWQRSPNVVAPDHVGVEWAFLAELSELSSREALELRRVFIMDHVRKWFPAFMDRLKTTVQGSYYPALGDFGMVWIESEVWR
jgi:TorA maturation chaperone TorD